MDKISLNTAVKSDMRKYMYIFLIRHGELVANKGEDLGYNNNF